MYSIGDGKRKFLYNYRAIESLTKKVNKNFNNENIIRNYIIILLLIKKILLNI